MPLPYAIAVAGYCFLLFYVSSDPAPPMPDLRFDAGDKLLHAIAFGILAFLFSVGMRASHRIYTPRMQFLFPILFTSAYGAIDEIHQYFVPGRHCDVWDWVADTAGAIVVQLVLCLWWWRLPILAGPPRYERD